MVYRYSWIAGVAAIALAYWELTALLRDSRTGTPWQIAILVVTLLGAGITWTAIAYRARAGVVVVVNLVAFVLTMGLLVAPETLWTILPTRETWDVVVLEFQRALDLIRYGVEPVRPVPGLVMLLGGLFWTLGFLLVAGLLNGRPFVAILTPLIVALQFVIIDRRPKELAHLAIFVGVVALSLLAIRLDERDSGSGRLQRIGGRTTPSRGPSPMVAGLLAVTLAVSMASVAFAGDRVPTSGLVPWRQPAGFTDEYSGSVAYNPFTDIRANVISQTNRPLFRAEVQGVEPDRLRFRTVTLDVYERGRWATDRVLVYDMDADEPWIEPEQEYRGETVEVRASIRIDDLAQPWLPAPVTTMDLRAFDEADQNDIGVRRLDGSVYLRGGVSYEGMTYAVRADVPVYDADTIATLARRDDGSLSPLFAAAEDDGATVPDLDEPLEITELPDEEFWLDYPEEELGTEFVSLSRRVVGNVTTNFEKALALETWFRDSGEFTYDDGVPAEFTTDDVYEWLSADEDVNPFARHGYCEQFATAMALMARSVGVPSRVVLGFTPGTALNDTTVQVLDRNAHSWVEVWIPAYGWMAFDPTPRSRYAAPTVNESLEEELGFAPADYVDDIPDPEFELADTGPIDPFFDDPSEQDPALLDGSTGAGSGPLGGDLPLWLTVLAVLAIGAGAVAIAMPAVKWIRRRRLARRLADGDVSAAWEDIVDRLIDLRETIDPASTPLEAAHAIDDAFVPLARSYDRALYGDGGTSTATVEAAEQARVRASQHLTTRYSRGERIRAVYRPSKLIARWRSLRSSLSLRR